MGDRVHFGILFRYIVREFEKVRAWLKPDVFINAEHCNYLESS